MVTNKDISKFIDELTTEKTELENVKEPAILSISSNLEIEIIKEAIKELSEITVNTDIPVEFINEKKAAEEELTAAQEVVAGIKATKDSQDRISELEETMGNMSSEFSKIEKFLFLYEKFNKKVAEQTEQPVNKMFGYVNFSLFETQVNGAIIPCCNVLNDEFKPFSSGQEVRGGIDIAGTFSEFYGIKAPLFIDNAESVTEYPDMDCQIIELCHSKEHKTLTQI